MRQPVHTGSDVQETLDIILSTAAFDQPVTLLFMDDGVTQLKNAQQPESFALKDTPAIFQALEIYDVKHIYVEAESLQERGLKPGDLCLPVTEIYRKDIHQFISQFERAYAG